MLGCASVAVALQDMSWSSWGPQGADGTGTASFKLCDPNCAAGSQLTEPVVVHAWNPQPPRREAICQVGLQIFADIRSQIGLPVLTDVHEKEQCAPVAEVVDVLQIPAFLSRQTDLLVAAAKTGKVVNVKKGQFLAPWDMKNVIAKITDAGNPNVLVTERGASFGYNTLVVDMTGLPEMAKFGAPVVMDSTHAVQKPGGQGDKSGGNREMAPVIARAAVAAGVACVFMETHEDPDGAAARGISDAPNMLYLNTVPALLADLVAIDAIVKHRKL